MPKKKHRSLYKKKLSKTLVKKASHALKKLSKPTFLNSPKEWLANLTSKGKKKKSVQPKKSTPKAKKQINKTKIINSKFIISEMYKDFIKASIAPKIVPKKTPSKKNNTEKVKDKEKKND